MQNLSCTYIPDSCPPGRACFLENTSDPYYAPQFAAANSSSLCLCLPPFVGPDCDELTAVGISIIVFSVLGLALAALSAIYGAVQGYRRFANMKVSKTIILSLTAAILAVLMFAAIQGISIEMRTVPGLNSPHPFGELRGLRVDFASMQRISLSVIFGGLTVVACLLLSGTWYDVAMRSKKLSLTNNSKRIQKVSVALTALFIIIFTVIFAIDQNLAFLVAALFLAILALVMCVGGIRLAIAMSSNASIGQGSETESTKAIDAAAKRVIKAVLCCAGFLILCLSGAPMMFQMYWPSRGPPFLFVNLEIVGGHMVMWGLLLVNVTIIFYIARAPKISNNSSSNRRLSRRISKTFSQDTTVSSRMSSRLSKELSKDAKQEGQADLPNAGLIAS